MSGSGQRKLHPHHKIVNYLGATQMAERLNRKLTTICSWKVNGVAWRDRRKVQDWLIQQGRADLVPDDFLGEPLD